MKKKLLITLFATLWCTSAYYAQSTETFEDEAGAATSFTDNGQVFNITDQLQGPIDIRSFSGTGWNGSAADNRYIANHTNITQNIGVAFTISSDNGIPFRLNSMYLKLGDYNKQVNVTGSVTIIGKLAGTMLFTTTVNSGFNQSIGLQNGFTLIDLSTFGGSDNSLTDIDQILISSTTDFNYIALDAFTWTKVPLAAAKTQTDVSCNGVSNGSATVTAIGGTPPYSYSWAPTGGTAASANGLTAGTYTVTITDDSSIPNVITKAFTIKEPTAISVSSFSQTNIACNGINSGSASVLPTGGTTPYTYNWTPSGGTAATASGLTAGTYTCTITDANSCSTTKNFTLTQPTALVVTTSNTNISCNGGSNGSASVSPTGGITPYTYSWTPSGGNAATASGLTAGTYTCTITDANSCTTTKNFTLTQPTALVATISSTNVSCNGGSNGSASVSPTGGTTPYTYNWAPSGGTAATASGLLAGTYTCTITDANNCSITKNVTITEPTKLCASTNQTDVSCNGGNNGSITVTPSCGTPPYTYSWAPSGGITAVASSLTAGTYTCTITDANGCFITKSTTITQPTAITATTSNTNIACNGTNSGAATVSPSGGVSPYTYSWTPSGGTAASANGLAAGTYTCTIKDANNCSITKNISITQPTSLMATTSNTNIDCNGGNNGSATVTPTGGTSPYTYMWAPSGSTTATVSGLTAGTYTCTITDDNNCSITKNVTITEPDLLVAMINKTDVSCYGGNNGSATVTIARDPAFTYSWAPYGGTAATANSLVAGTYTCTITYGNNCTIEKIISVDEPNVIINTQLVTICAGDSIIVNNHIYKNSGLYKDTLSSKNSCDSILNTTLTVLPKIETSRILTICAGDSMVVGNKIYKTSGIYTDVFTSINNCDSIAIIDLTVLPFNTASQTLTICAGDSLKIGNHFYKISGTYIDTLISKNSCDSILTTNLTVASVIDNTVQLNGNTIIANATGATYKWFNCTTMEIILGATSNSFTPSLAGDYAVVVTINECSDTSICTNVIITGIANNNVNNTVIIWPNPTTGIFTIKNAVLGDYRIVNSLGQVVEEFKINSTQHQMDMEEFKNGLYYIMGTNNNQLFKQKIIVNK